MKVAIIFGSKSDTDVMRGAANCLREFGIEFEAHILSAHRVPEKLVETLKRLEGEDTQAIIAGAGLAAHLPGVIASKTILQRTHELYKDFLNTFYFIRISNYQQGLLLPF